MKNSKDQNNNTNILKSWPFLFVMFIILAIFTWNIIVFIGKMLDTKKNINMVESHIKDLDKSIDKLTLDIDNLNSEVGVEKNIRENFGLVKEGEGLVIIVEDKNIIKKQDKNSLWKKILSWLK